MSHGDVVVVLVTAPGAAVGQGIARTLVGERLAACVNVVPGVRSIYRWEDGVQEDDEHLLVLKARADDVPALTARIVALHPYEVPEVLALPAVGGAVPYLEWVWSATARA